MPWMNAGDLSNWSWSRLNCLFVWHHSVCKDSHVSAVLSRNLMKILKKSEWMWVWEILVFASARNLQHPRWPPSQPGRQHSTPPRKSKKSDISFSMQSPHHMSTICVRWVVLNIASKEAGCKRSWGRQGKWTQGEYEFQYIGKYGEEHNVKCGPWKRSYESLWGQLRFHVTADRY